MEKHDLCAIFPEISSDDFESLKESIAENGLRHPVVLYEDQILDGYHRHRACLEVGVEPSYETFGGSYEDAIKLVVDENIRRRHLTPSQLAMAAAKLVTTGHEPGRPEKGENLPFSADRAGKQFGISDKSVKHARTVQEHGGEELNAAVVAGDVSVDDAYKVARQVKEGKANTGQVEVSCEGRKVWSSEEGVCRRKE